MKNKIFDNDIGDLEERLCLEEKINKVKLGRIVYLGKEYPHRYYKTRIKETYQRFRDRKIFPDRG